METWGKLLLYGVEKGPKGALPKVIPGFLAIQDIFMTFSQKPH
ncbi:MAG: hypothetical protein ACJAVO_001358 [Parvibaculaceae bacterium]